MGVTRAATALAVVLAVGGLAAPAATATTRHPVPHCSAGPRTLSAPGTRVYPDVGNGGYVSVHTDVDLVYDNAANRFLAGNHVVLHDRATQCLSAFSLDFERKSIDAANGPNMQIRSIRVDGVTARWRFVRPTYPGDPHGPNDPNPKAHQASQLNPVGGPKHNRLPPACSPEIPEGSSKFDARNGTMCPANKLVVTPAKPIASGRTFTVDVSYVGRPGVHDDGDGTTDGWFKASDGGFVTTEPLGTEDWMPLNNYPAAKPTYDFYDTVPAGVTAVCNGVLVGTKSHGPSALFPHGSTTYHWHQASPVPSYLVEDSIGDYSISKRIADNGMPFYTVQDTNIPPGEQQANAAVIGMQEDITQYESEFNGPFPFASDGVAVGTPSASFEEEMETMITFAGGGPIDPSTLYHENMHQWWGDNVTEGSFAMTFFKEGMATLAEYLFQARTAETAAGGPSSPSGQMAFEQSLVTTFNQNYASTGSFWTQAPSNPTAGTLFDTNATYTRPGIAYTALRQILGATNFGDALRAIQAKYGGSAITEPQLEAMYQGFLPRPTAACHQRLTAFFHQWFDTAYAPDGGANRPQITGPGLQGTNFYGHGGCAA